MMKTFAFYGPSISILGRAWLDHILTGPDPWLREGGHSDVSKFKDLMSATSPFLKSPVLSQRCKAFQNSNVHPSPHFKTLIIIGALYPNSINQSELSSSLMWAAFCRGFSKQIHQAHLLGLYCETSFPNLSLFEVGSLLSTFNFLFPLSR
jgi:hypothetical protein